MRLLHIDSSVLGGNSVSRALTQAVVEQWRGGNLQMMVSYRDLAAVAPNHLSGEILAAAAVPPEQRSAAQREELALSDALLEEFLAADVLVVGAPMYNFSIPSQLKAWLDRVMVAGRTFKYTDRGPVGLAGDKQVVIVSSRGGVYGDQAAARAMDHQESYLKGVFGFLGIADVTTIRAEGLSVPAQRERAIAAAYAQVRGLLQAA